MNTIQEQWEQFRKLIVPADAPPVQVQEMRRSFYAGVEAMLRIQLAFAAYEEDTAVVMLEGIYDECTRFAEDVAKGLA